MSENIEESKQSIPDKDFYKVVIVGSPGSGKSSIIQNIVGKPFNPDIKSTNCYEIHIKKFQHGSKDYEVRFWDCSAYHYQSYSSVKKAFYRGAHMCLVVVDVTQLDSVDEWIQECFENEIYNIYVIGNKIDYKTEDDQDKNLQQEIFINQQDKKELEEFKKQIEDTGLKMFLGSAKSPQKDYISYFQLVQQLLKDQSSSHSQIQKFESERFTAQKLKAQNQNQSSEPHSEISPYGTPNAQNSQKEQEKKSSCNLF